MILTIFSFLLFQTISADSVQHEIISLLPAKDKLNVVSVAVLSENETSYFSYNSDSINHISNRTNYEIGSITKVFTAYLFYETYKDSLDRLNQPISNFIDLKTASKEVQNITLIELLTHHSGLDRIDMSEIFKVWNMTNPYQYYTYESLTNYLNSTSLNEKKYNYSNVGFMTLGLVLEKIYRKPIASIFEEKIYQKFKMKHSGFQIDSLTISSYDMFNNEVTFWTGEACQTVGLLKSNTYDLSLFLNSIMENKNGEFTEFMKPTKMMSDSTGVGFGWHFKIQYSDTLVWHNGGTYGFSSFMGFYKQKKKGIIILNNYFPAQTTQAGIEILNRMCNYGNSQLPERALMSKINPANMKYYYGFLFIAEIVLFAYATL